MSLVLLIHGGAVDRVSNAERKAWPEAIADIVQAGFALLKDGASALDAVTQAVVLLEDSGLFNAGKGSVHTRIGTVETDAAIMDGQGEHAGAVMAVSAFKNPIRAARQVMEQTRHVALAGPQAEAVLAELGGCETIDPATYYKPFKIVEDMGTVGAVALDHQGRLAAATSTGGIKNKYPGRVGDSPIIGAGCYANAHVAISCTGKGEFFMRAVAAHRLAMLTETQSLGAAAHATLEHVKALGGSGGLIAVDAAGNIAMPFNSQGMIRGVVGENIPMEVKI